MSLIIAVIDDEAVARRMMVSTVREVLPDADIHDFSSAEKLLAFAAETPIAIAFVDIQMRGISGTELARKLQNIQPQTNIIFCTAYDEYKSEAMDLRASGYLMKPVMAEDIQAELKMLRFPLKIESAPAEAPAAEQLKAVCFGAFRCTFRGEALPFLYHKTNELLAVLIDKNGELCSNALISEMLWESGESHFSYLKRLRRDLKDTLARIGIENAVYYQRGGLGIRPEAVQCDYYDFLAGSQAAVNAYDGEYMTQFSWAEETNARLYWKKEEILTGKSFYLSDRDA